MTDRVHEQLVRRWGRRVFMDIGSLAGGDLFAEEVERNLQSCAVVLVVRGRSWLSLTDDQGRWRVDDPADYPRMEVAAAIRRGIGGIPVLVGNAVLPEAEELPADIAGLADRQAIRVARERFEADVDRLLAAVALEMPGRSWRLWMGLGAAAGLATLALAAGGYLLWDKGAQDQTPPPAVAVGPAVAQPDPHAASPDEGPASSSGAGASEPEAEEPPQPTRDRPETAAAVKKPRPAAPAAE